MADKYQRNPHPDFKSTEASRQEWDANSQFRYTKTPNPDWAFGDGANHLHEPYKASPAQDATGTGPDTTAASATDAGTAQQEKQHVVINPYQEGRPAGFNYKLLISSIVPRPIAFLSTRSPDGKTTNLAPFSYFNMLNHDPPLFTVGFASALAPGAAKDSLANLRDSGECVINIISEGFVEAANAAAVNAPYGASEWDVSGLTPVYDCEEVKCARVKEAIFSIEAKVDLLKEYESRAAPGKKTGTVAILEGVRFWAREDAVNGDKNLIDPAVSTTFIFSFPLSFDL